MPKPTPSPNLQPTEPNLSPDPDPASDPHPDPNPHPNPHLNPHPNPHTRPGLPRHRDLLRRGARHALPCDVRSARYPPHVQAAACVVPQLGRPGLACRPGLLGRALLALGCSTHSGTEPGPPRELVAVRPSGSLAGPSSPIMRPLHSRRQPPPAVLGGDCARRLRRRAAGGHRDPPRRRHASACRRRRRRHQSSGPTLAARTATLHEYVSVVLWDEKIEDFFDGNAL